MLFNSMIFIWLFFPAVFLLYLLSARVEVRNLVLLLASLLFYAWGEPEYVILLLISIFLNWGSALMIGRCQAGTGRKALLAVNIIMNLFILGYYKYFNFAVQVINHFAGSTVLTEPETSIPLGISFFTFSALTYVIDLYRGRYQAEKNILKVALYILLFQKILSGPIVRYQDVYLQLDDRKVTVQKTAEGLRRFAYGLGKKVLIANILAEYVDAVWGGTESISQMSGIETWIAVVFYTLQIYYDFSGYSDMAIGLAEIFGFEFKENFNYPYLSASVQEFWRRWHISLGNWFKEYLYIPLGGNRKGTVRTCFNLLVVFFTTGLWHGASWNFILWGMYHGFFQILERLGLMRILKKHRWLGHLYAVLAVFVGWVFFRADTLGDAFLILKRLAAPWHYVQTEPLVMTGLTRKMIAAAVGGVLGSGGIQVLGSGLKSRWVYSAAEWVYCFAVLILSMMMMAGNTYNAFIYFQF